MPRFDLRRLILLLALAAVLLTVCNGFYSGYQVQREILIRNTLEAHRVYAAKVAYNTELYLHATQQNLKVNAVRFAEHIGEPVVLQRELDLLARSSDTFNGVLVVNAQGVVLAANALPGLVGKRLDSPGSRWALAERRPLISKPYQAVTGQLVVVISQPLHGRDGRYLGYVGGSIRLREKNILHGLLGEHYYRDGSYLYVVDDKGRLIFHRDPSRIMQDVSGNPVVGAAIRGESGARPVANTLGQEMLAGYATVPSAHWGVVSQRPRERVLAELDRLMLTMAKYAAPLLLLIVPVVWWLSLQIARPLRQLAREAATMDSHGATPRIEAVRSWYFEAQQLKQALLVGMRAMQKQLSRFRQESNTDALTGLGNRRELDGVLDDWTFSRQPFAVLMIDIDFFKTVNDSYGHDTGDRVLAALAQLMRNTARDGDVLCRMGGEEFVMLLPGADAAGARRVAERLRAQVEAHQTPGLPSLTVSIGVAAGFAGAAPQTLLLEADDALYQAKQQGRNRVVLAA